MSTEVGIILRNFAENPKDREKRFFILKRRIEKANYDRSFVMEAIL